MTCAHREVTIAMGRDRERLERGFWSYYALWHCDQKERKKKWAGDGLETARGAGEICDIMTDKQGVGLCAA